MPPLTIHHLRVAQSERIVWLCEELGLAYTLRSYDRVPLAAPEELKAVEGNALGKAPLIEDGTADQRVCLGETGAIVEYILTRYGGGSALVVDPSRPNWPDYLYWLHAGNGSLQPLLTNCMAITVAGAAPDAFISQFYTSSLASWLAHIDARLEATGAYLAGPAFTVADIMVVFSLTTFRHFYRFSLEPYPRILAFLATIGQRPAYRAAFEKCNPGWEPMLGAEPPAKTIFETVQGG